MAATKSLRFAIEYEDGESVRIDICVYAYYSLVIIVI
jgi:hypothetical protein